MTYFKIGTNDISNYVQDLKISENPNYKSLTNAAGNSRVDLITTKRVFKVTLRPLSNTEISTVLGYLSFSCNISYLNPVTGSMVNNVACILDKHDYDYYWIVSATKKMTKKITLTFKEL